HQVTPKECHLHAVKRIFRSLKGHPKLGLWYLRASPFDLVAFSDSDYGGASQDRKSTTRGSQFLGRRLISWQCKKQTIVATSTTKAKYVAAASCCGQVLLSMSCEALSKEVSISILCLFDDILGVSISSDETIGVEADVSNIETSISASLTPTLKIHKDHPKSQIIGPVDTPIQTRHKSKMVEEQSFMAIIHQKTDPDLFQFCLYSCFLSQVEPKRVSDDLQDLSWVEAIQEELLQFKIQKVWNLVDCPKGVRPIGTK
nr:putative ribonuclease H-like domain-containing protein [Tanacetum cinerariifolium]